MDARYLAGFCDGDGSIRVKRKKERYGFRYMVEVWFTNRCYQLLADIQSQYGGSIYLMKPGAANHRVCYHYSLTCQRARPLLDDIVEHLSIKKAQAEYCLEMLEHQRRNGSRNRSAKCRSAEELEFQEKVWIAVRALNKTGVEILQALAEI